MAFAQHVKMQMPEEYQANWLNKTGEDKLLIDTFDQLQRKKYQDLLQCKEEIEKDTGNQREEKNGGFGFFGERWRAGLRDRF